MRTVSPGLRAGCNCFDKKTHHFFGFLGKQILLPDDDLPVPLSVLAPFKDVPALCAHSETHKCACVWMSVLCLKYSCHGTGEMAQCLRILIGHTGDQSSVSSTHTVAHNYL